jgi:hypothetical protein
MNRLLKAAIIGAAIGIITEFVVRPYIEKPLEKQVEKVL